MEPSSAIVVCASLAAGLLIGRFVIPLRRGSDQNESLRRARAILNALPDSWLVIDEHEQIVELHIGPRPGSNAPLAKLRGRHVEDFFSKAVVEKLRVARSACLKDGVEQAFEFDWHVRGDARAAHARVLPLGGGDVVVVVTDVSERKLAERTLRETKEFAESMLGARTDAFARLSHDVRNQLTGVLTMTDLLLTQDTAPARRYLETIQRCGDNIIELVTNMMELSRIERGSMSLHPVPVALPSMLQECVEIMRPQAAEGVSVSLEVAVDAPATALVDAARLRQIVMNLLHNAIKFTSQGSVRVALDAVNEARFRIRVTDTGRGIPRATLPRIFDAYFQAHEADGADDRRRAGSGLGLAIVRELARALGGEVAVESEEGQGTCFSVVLPMRPS